MTDSFRQSPVPIFFTVALAARGQDLLIREIGRLRAAVRQTRADHPFGIEAFVILPDHLHAIWTLPAGESDPALRWRLIKSRFAAALPKPPRPAGQAESRPLWQPRFWGHPLRTQEDFALHLRGCWMDPVRHGLVEEPHHWPHSSFARPPRLRESA